jgi:magnesium-transporting ATPase (P-type)
MSLGTGAEIAAEAADMVLVRGNVADVCTALDLSRVMFRRIQLNLFFSLVYNCLGIPVAAGVFYPFIRSRLPPTLAAVAMALSSLSVVSSSLALRLYVPPDVETYRHESLFHHAMRRVWTAFAFAASNYGDATPTRENNNDLTQPLLFYGGMGVDETETAVAVEEGGFSN